MVEGQIPIQEYETGNTKHKWNLKKIKQAHYRTAEYEYKKGEIKKDDDFKLEVEDFEAEI